MCLGKYCVKLIHINAVNDIKDDDNSDTNGRNVRHFYTSTIGEERSKGETCKGQLLFFHSREQQVGGGGEKIRGVRAVVRFTCR